MAFQPKILSTETEFIRCNGERIEYFKAPTYRYDELIEDIQQIPYLSPISEQVTTIGSKYIIKTKSKDQGMIAAFYISGLYASELEETDFSDWESDETDILFEGDTFLVISDNDLRAYWYQSNEDQHALSSHRIAPKGKEGNQIPFWEEYDRPLLIHIREETAYSELKEMINSLINPLILILYEEAGDEGNSWGWGGECNKEIINQLVFEQDYEVLEIGQCTEEYERSIVTDNIELRGYTLEYGIIVSKLIKRLKAYRKQHYKEEDLRKWVTKAILKAEERGGEKVLIEEDFTLRDYSTEETEVKAKISTKKEGKGQSALEELIGLTGVKDQLHEVVARLKLEKLRQEKGYQNAPIYMNMVFLGNPGVAKTTVARIFANWLIEEDLLTCKVFKEVARKDLVGQYVGWTARTVAEIFEEIKGGVLFIDEAYALTDEESMKDGFSGEAIAEIIRQMENNRDTVVIFAGYKGEKMNQFMDANPGIKSRISFQVEFDDYKPQELWKIVEYHAKKTGFKLERGMEKIVLPFFEEVVAGQEKDFGNGRMARKLLEISTTFMATRIYKEKGEDLELITNEDMHHAVQSIRKQEVIRKDMPIKNIGFRM